MIKKIAALLALSAVCLFAQAATPIQVTINQPVTLTATADGTSPFTYVWKKDGVTLPNTTSVIVIKNAQLSDAGTYTCQISNSAGSNTPSNSFQVILVIPSNGKITIVAG